MSLVPGWFRRIPKRVRLVGLACLGLLLLGPLWMGAKIAKTKHSALWAPTYMRELLGGRYGANDEAQHFIFLMCDHWEPGGGPRGQGKANRWLADFEPVSARHLDSQGRNFQYTWFYPIDNFDEVVLDSLASSSGRGFGEIEVHWHHHHDGRESFTTELQDALTRFAAAGALVSAPDASPQFAFIHGNWTLDNSGASRFCGVDEEITALMELGCYGDFTFPALGTSAQPKMINRIFYAQDTPEPKSYDLTATPSIQGKIGSGLMILPGPLGLDFRDPRIFIEYAALDDAQGSGFTGRFFGPDHADGYFKPHRVDLWNRIAVGVEGKPEWVFAKIHAHGVQQRDVLLDGGLEAMLTAVEDYCDEKNLKLHYVTAREAYNLVKAAEAGLDGPPQKFYDFEIPPPLSRTRNTSSSVVPGSAP